ncbi:hypothetical protein J6590_002613 [Homalodisca vitripennis]|nr:hypothetical protein J6590_002613 [Homalodisca vitripennis]
MLLYLSLKCTNHHFNVQRQHGCHKWTILSLPACFLHLLCVFVKVEVALLSIYLYCPRVLLGDASARSREREFKTDIGDSAQWRILQGGTPSPVKPFQKIINLVL